MLKSTPLNSHSELGHNGLKKSKSQLLNPYVKLKIHPPLRPELLPVHETVAAKQFESRPVLVLFGDDEIKWVGFHRETDAHTAVVVGDGYAGPVWQVVHCAWGEPSLEHEVKRVTHLFRGLHVKLFD